MVQPPLTYRQQDGIASCDLGVWVELDQGTQVLQWVLLQRSACNGRLLWWQYHTLDLITVDQACHVSIGHLGGGQLVTLLQIRLAAISTCSSADILVSLWGL